MRISQRGGIRRYRKSHSSSVPDRERVPPFFSASETTGSRPEELRDSCRCGTPAHGLEWEQRETRVVVESLGRWELGEKALMEETTGVEIQQQGVLVG